MSTQNNELLLSIIEYFEKLKDGNYNNNNLTNIITLIEDEFNLQDKVTIFKQSSYYPNSLNDIFDNSIKTLNLLSYQDTLTNVQLNNKFESFVNVVKDKGYFDGTNEDSIEYLQRNAKLIKKFNEKSSKTLSSSSSSSTSSNIATTTTNNDDDNNNVKLSKEEAELKAEELKFKGNAAINNKNFEEAIQHYTDALNYSSDGSNSHVYYSNRAAAYCHINNYIEAVNDCESCIALESNYVKAYSRLGLANFFLERYDDAIYAYEKACELEPNNQSNIDSLKKAKSKLQKLNKNNNTISSSSNNNNSSGGDLPSGLPPGMLNNPAIKQAMNQIGGTSGLANMMKDPKMMAMAQEMMKDPKMMQQAMSMLGGGGGGGGGMPDMSALASMMGGKF